jgi:hypothetical protein
MIAKRLKSRAADERSPLASLLAQNADIDGEDTNNPMALANFNMTSNKRMSAE